MKATIWHNPACGTSRKTLAILQDVPGIALTVVEYLATPPSAEKLAQLYRDAGMTDVSVTLYPAARHEILNETNRGEVTADIIAWLRAHAA